MENNEKIQPQQLPNQEFDYVKVAKILLARWYWIVSSVVVCYIIADIDIWYTPKIYQSQASIKIDDKKNEISNMLGDAPSTDKASKMQSELIVLKSTNLITNAVKDLNYPISFYIEGRIKVKTVELYPQRPVTIQILKLDTNNFYRDLIKFRPLDDVAFELTYKWDGKEVKRNYVSNQIISIGNNSFKIVRDKQDRATYLFGFNSVKDLVGRVKGELSAIEAQKNSNIIALSITNDANPQFAADALNAIMAEYIRYDRNQKQRSSDQIINFIDDQLDTISEKVRQSNSALEDYKQKTKVVNVGTAGEVQINKSAELEAQRDALQIQASLLRQFKNEILANKNDSPISFPVETNTDAGLSALLANFNTLLNQKNSFLQTYNANAPNIRMIDEQLSKNKVSAVAYLNKISDQLNQKLKYLDEQIDQANQRLAMLPVAEQRLANLTRDFEVNDKKYTFLSEKKLDAQISRSAVSTSASIVEAAQPNFGQIAPDEHGIRRMGIFIGLLLGLGLIILIRILNPYIYDKETIESLTSIPIIGVIRRFSRKSNEDDNEILVLSQPKSIFSESVRSVRTNLSYLASDKKNKVICITSEVAGEGKSFVAVNLSSTLSLIDKKVVLVAADLRRSKLHKTFHVSNDTGLSKYLSNQATLDEIILHTSQNSLDFIPSGPVPPNPSELLHTEKMKELVNILRSRYDIVMIDTAPVGLVSDSIPLIRLSDVNVFVIRSGKSKYYAATIPQRIDNEYNLGNSVIILNAFEEDVLHSRYYTTRFTSGSYGGRYYYYSDYSGYENSGYYMDSNKKKWWDITRWIK